MSIDGYYKRLAHEAVSSSDRERTIETLLRMSFEAGWRSGMNDALSRVRDTEKPPDDAITDGAWLKAILAMEHALNMRILGF